VTVIECSERPVIQLHAIEYSDHASAPSLMLPQHMRLPWQALGDDTAAL
jgi:hypothetical protein